MKRARAARKGSKMPIGDIEITESDTRSLKAPVPADPIQTEQIGKFLTNAGQDGYSLIKVTAITTGQRDPYTIGAIFTVSK